MKAGILKFVKRMRLLFILFSVVCIPAFMVCLVFAVSGYFAFYIISPALAVLWIAVYATYALRVSMGLVISVETTDKVVYLQTKRKTFTYDVRMGCVDMKVYKNKFVGTFETQDSRDKFVFYRRVPLGKYSEEQFTEREIEKFYPRVGELPVR